MKSIMCIIYKVGWEKKKVEYSQYIANSQQLLDSIHYIHFPRDKFITGGD